MVDLSYILEYLKRHLSYERYAHSMEVGHIAEKLAKHYGCDIGKAKLAGLIHDCCKEEKYENLVNYAKKCGFPVDEESYKIPEILHGPASVYICRTLFGIEDEDILSSIRYHVTGRENMSIMEKIIFIGDYIEPSRKFEGIEGLRALAYENLDTAMLCALDLSILYLIKKRRLLHHDTVDARNFLIDRFTQI